MSTTRSTRKDTNIIVMRLTNESNLVVPMLFELLFALVTYSLASSVEHTFSTRCLQNGASLARCTLEYLEKLDGQHS